MSSVSIPVPDDSPTPISTDEVDLGSGPAHVQHVKLVDGKDGGTHRMAVNGSGGIYTSDLCAGAAGFVTDAASGAYADGDAVTSGAVLTDWPSGMWRCNMMTVGSGTGAPLPPMGVLVVSSPTAAPWTATDHAPPTFALPTYLLSSAAALYVPAADFEAGRDGSGAVMIARPEVTTVMSDGLNLPTPANACHLTLVPICEGGWSDDMTSGLLVASFWTLVGAA